jgi:hypothetical protein
MRCSLASSSFPSRTIIVEFGLSVSWSHARTTHPVPSSVIRLLSSGCMALMAPASSAGSSLMIRTRPKFAPTFSTHFLIAGMRSTFEVQTPSLSGLPSSQKPRGSCSPLAEARMAKFVSPPDFQSMYSSASHSSRLGIGPSYFLSSM